MKIGDLIRNDDDDLGTIVNIRVDPYDDLLDVYEVYFSTYSAGGSPPGTYEMNEHDAELVYSTGNEK